MSTIGIIATVLAATPPAALVIYALLPMPAGKYGDIAIHTGCQVDFTPRG